MAIIDEPRLEADGRTRRMGQDGTVRSEGGGIMTSTLDHAVGGAARDTVGGNDSSDPRANAPRIERRKRPRPEEWTCRPGMVNELPDQPFQELWFELRSWGWRSLVFVPTVRGVSEFDVAERLVVVGVLNTKEPITLVSAEGVSVNDSDDVIAMIRTAEARGERVVVVVDPVLDNAATGPVIRAVNGAVLVVRLGESDRAGIDRSLATARH